MTNNNIFCFCDDGVIAKYAPFGIDNIRKRYRDVKEKRFLYNAMQLNAYIEENEITEEQLRIALDSIIGAKKAIKEKLLKGI